MAPPAHSCAVSAPGLPGAARFDIHRAKRLGSGSASEVVKGTDTETGRGVAVKIAHKAREWQRGRGLQDECANIANEVRILTGLNAGKHPNVLRLLGFWEDEAASYIVTELCSKPLLAYIDRHGTGGRILPRLLAEVVCGLRYLERRGVVHRDIKPDNLLLSHDIHVRIADYGTAVYVDALEESGFAGSPEYCPPEMFTNSRSSGMASDIWSLGCVFYQVFVGHGPFHGIESEYKLFEQIKAGTYDTPALTTGVDATGAPLAPPAMRDLVQRMLVVDPAARPGLDDIEASEYFVLTEVDWANLHECCNITAADVDHTESLERYLLANETVIHASAVVKSRHLTKKKRQLVLTTYPRLFYVDLETDAVKGSIDIGRGSRAAVVDATNFEVQTPGRVYYLADQDGCAELWVQKINEVIEGQG